MYDIIEDVKRDLSVNFNEEDLQVLQELINRVTTNALFISNRKNTDDNIELLKNEIEECAKTIYLQRGTEDVNTISQSGISQSFKNAVEDMRNNIILNGKRLVK